MTVIYNNEQFHRTSQTDEDELNLFYSGRFEAESGHHQNKMSVQSNKKQCKQDMSC